MPVALPLAHLDSGKSIQVQVSSGAEMLDASATAASEIDPLLDVREPDDEPAEERDPDDEAETEDEELLDPGACVLPLHAPTALRVAPSRTSLIRCFKSRSIDQFYHGARAARYPTRVSRVDLFRRYGQRCSVGRQVHSCPDVPASEL